MAIQLGQIAPDFEQDSTEGRIRFHEWLGDSWGILFSHPKDYTPVCTTELAEAARLKPEWAKRNVKVIGLSVDPASSHQGWEKDIEETQGQKVNFPIVADADQTVSKLYDMVHPLADPTVTVRSVFVIDPAKKVRSQRRTMSGAVTATSFVAAQQRHAATAETWNLKPEARGSDLEPQSTERTKK